MTESVDSTRGSRARFKVGQLAKRTGLTVRTLHHWHDLGLLVPSHRSASGHRLYDENDLLRLQQVVSLRQLGFPLEDIRDLLDGGRIPPLQVLETHLARAREQLEAQHELVRRLEHVAAGLRSVGKVSAEELILTVEATNMFEKYYSLEQLEQLRQRREQIGEERIREAEAEWPRLIAEARAQMEAGADPAGETVQALARRWKALIDEFTGSDPGIERSLANLWKGEPDLPSQHGIEGLDGGLFEYVGRAMAALKPTD